MFLANLQNDLAKLVGFPSSSRVWVYQANRQMTLEEVQFIEREMASFVASWAAHGKPMKATFALVLNTFIVLVADEAVCSASGCSIDASVRVVKALGASLQIDFFDRFAIAFAKENQFSCLSKAAFQAYVAKETPDFVFDNRVERLEQLNTQWCLPYAKSWQKDYFSQNHGFSLSL
jgi:hypothetical protein